jgi:flagellar motor switch protein FliN
MTTEMLTVTEDVALAVGAAAAAALPSAEPLTASAAWPGDPEVAGPYAAAVLAELGTGLTGSVAVLIGDELSRAVQDSPVPGLDLAAAVQPALDAAAGALGGSVQVGRAVPPAEVAALLGGQFTVIPLVGTGNPVAMVLVSDTALGGRPTAPEAPAAAAPAAAPAPSRGIEMLHGVDMEVTVELGRTRLTVRELLALAPGQVLELARAAGSPADLLVNGLLIARGEVVVVDEDFGLRITEIVDESVAG